MFGPGIFTVLVHFPGIGLFKLLSGHWLLLTYFLGIDLFYRIVLKLGWFSALSRLWPVLVLCPDIVLF
jgi:hypothetical protein